MNMKIISLHLAVETSACSEHVYELPSMHIFRIFESS
ncbi:hypothetical protein T01_3962 [Trichinella spiralis]|uniref:Uncharacterized protein n=1 Tax=Trichinella spiralis TaxID=6334 RepID=A0A0V0Z127_TRISP|nr:hypothetical protein T01_3962 [Trichinella spiralis]